MLKSNLNDAQTKQITPSYAPQYSKQERTDLILKYVAWSITVAVPLQFAFFPWLRGYAVNAHCYQYGSFTGYQFLIYGIFIGLPLLTTVVLVIVIGQRSLRLIKLAQDPLPNEKVFRPTQYRYGKRPQAKGYYGLLLILLSGALSVQGYFWAQSFFNPPPNVIHHSCPN
jgi:hypothetical protein